MKSQPESQEEDLHLLMHVNFRVRLSLSQVLWLCLLSALVAQSQSKIVHQNCDMDAGRSGVCHDGMQKPTEVKAPWGRIRSIRSDDALSFKHKREACETWWISNNTAGNVITISFEILKLPEYEDCLGDHVCIGPSPEVKICGAMPTIPYIYISQKDHVWIKYVKRPVDWSETPYQSEGFSLNYTIGKLSPSQICPKKQFQCENGKCIMNSWRCNGANECEDGSDEWNCAATVTTVTPCPDDTFSCMPLHPYKQHKAECFSTTRRCDGMQDCKDNQDENNCDTCGERAKEGPYGFITSPNFAVGNYPSNTECEWTIHVNYPQRIQLRFITFKLENNPETDYITVYDGATVKHSKVLGTYYGSNNPKILLTSGNRAVILFRSDKNVAEHGFNISYQQKGYCFGEQIKCGAGENDCYLPSQRCNEVWDCKFHGGDERGCDHCDADKFPCGKGSNHCYSETEHCNGVGHCLNNRDELQCDPLLCGPHNGTFLCDNKRCIYENWRCDGTNDCLDNSDEISCSSMSSVRVITAAVIGSLICALLLVIALGCTCKLYALRLQESGTGHRYDSPLSQLQQEMFLRRRAPPPYNEAMASSRPFEEAQREFMEQIIIATNRRNRNRRRPPRPPPPSHIPNSSGGRDSPELQTDVTQISTSDQNDAAEIREGAVPSDAHDSTEETQIDHPSPIPPTTTSDSDDDSDSEPESDVNISLATGMSAQWRKNSHPHQKRESVASSSAGSDCHGADFDADGLNNTSGLHKNFDEDNLLEQPPDGASIDADCASGSVDSVILSLEGESSSKLEIPDTGDETPECDRDDPGFYKQSVPNTSLFCARLPHVEQVGSDGGSVGSDSVDVAGESVDIHGADDTVFSSVVEDYTVDVPDDDTLLTP